jgi:hypothetical protein
MVSIAAGRLDASPGQMIEEGQPFPPVEAVAQGIEWATGGRGDRLSHGDLLGLVRGGYVEPPSYQPRGSLSWPRGRISLTSYKKRR